MRPVTRLILTVASFVILLAPAADARAEAAFLCYCMKAAGTGMSASCDIDKVQAAGKYDVLRYTSIADDKDTAISDCDTHCRQNWPCQETKTFCYKEHPDPENPQVETVVCKSEPYGKCAPAKDYCFALAVPPSEFPYYCSCTEAIYPPKSHECIKATNHIMPPDSRNKTFSMDASSDACHKYCREIGVLLFDYAPGYGQCQGDFGAGSLTPEDLFASGVVTSKCPPGTPPGARCLKNPIGVTTVAGLVGNILKAMLGVLGSLTLLMFIYGGFLWLTSGGSADKIGKGKDVMKWAAIGLFLVFAAAAAVRFVLGAFTTL